MKLFSTLLLAPLVGARVVRINHEPLRTEAGVAPGIGIHLTTSYAMAAIRYPDGQVEDLIRVSNRTTVGSFKTRRQLTNPSCKPTKTTST